MYHEKNRVFPLPRRESYIYKLIDKTEQLLKRMRWKALFYDNDNTSHRKKNQSENKNNCFTMKSRKCPSQVESMKGFEKDLTKMIENIQFRRVSSTFLLKLDEDIKNIKCSKKMFISADIAQNFYEIKKEDHEKILYKNMTKIYKKTNPSLPKKINKEAKKIIKEFNLDDKLNIMAKQRCFVTIKDHKPDFRTNPKNRLLNPTKSELGKLSKHILQTINTELQNKLKVNQW